MTETKGIYEVRPLSIEEEKIIAVAVDLAKYFIDRGHTSADLKAAILSTMHIRL